MSGMLHDGISVMPDAPVHEPLSPKLQIVVETSGEVLLFVMASSPEAAVAPTTTGDCSVEVMPIEPAAFAAAGRSAGSRQASRPTASASFLRRPARALSRWARPASSWRKIWLPCVTWISLFIDMPGPKLERGRAPHPTSAVSRAARTRAASCPADVPRPVGPLPYSTAPGAGSSFSVSSG